VDTPTQIRQRLNEEVERIRGYEDLTEEAKQRRIAEAREKAQAEYQEAVEAEERTVQERAERAEKALFQSSYPYGASEVEMWRS
jgi:regulator of protease activity HflC (stomatin/prohibitin superfamily)